MKHPKFASVGGGCPNTAAARRDGVRMVVVIPVAVSVVTGCGLGWIYHTHVQSDLPSIAEIRKACRS